MDVGALIEKQVHAAELLADALADAVDGKADTDTIRDFANATACTIDKLATLHGLTIDAT